MKVANAYTNQMSAFAAEYCGDYFNECIKLFKACANVIKNHNISKIKELIEYTKLQDSSEDYNNDIINDNLLISPLGTDFPKTIMLMENRCSVEPSESTSNKENNQTCTTKTTQSDSILEHGTHSLELKDLTLPTKVKAIGRPKGSRVTVIGRQHKRKKN